MFAWSGVIKIEIHCDLYEDNYPQTGKKRNTLITKLNLCMYVLCPDKSFGLFNQLQRLFLKQVTNVVKGLLDYLMIVIYYGLTSFGIYFMFDQSNQTCFVLVRHAEPDLNCGCLQKQQPASMYATRFDTSWLPAIQLSI